MDAEARQVGGSPLYIGNTAQKIAQRIGIEVPSEGIKGLPTETTLETFMKAKELTNKFRKVFGLPRTFSITAYIHTDPSLQQTRIDIANFFLEYGYDKRYPITSVNLAHALKKSNSEIKSALGFNSWTFSKFEEPYISPMNAGLRQEIKNNKRYLWVWNKDRLRKYIPLMEEFLEFYPEMMGTN